MSEWLFAAVAGLCMVGAIGLLFRQRQRRIAARLEKRRSNPSFESFLALLEGQCDRDVAAFVWDELAVYWAPARPHPNDLITDLGIDPDEPEDWLGRFCHANGLQSDEFGSWPEDLPLTVGNLARWLSSERTRLRAR